MTPTEMTPYERVLRARIQLQKKARFIYGILFYATYRMADESDDNLSFRTAYADALGNIVIFPEFIEGKHDTFIETLLYHEAVHLVLKHPILGHGRIRALWYICADIKANQYCSEAGYSVPKDWIVNEPPPGHPYNRRDKDFYITLNGKQYIVVDYQDKSAIRIYDELLEQLKKDKNLPTILLSGYCGDGVTGGWGLRSDRVSGHSLWENLTPEERQTIEGQLNDRIRSAYVSSKQRGDIPAGLERLIKELLETKLNWKAMLRCMITATMPYEPSYERPHKRTFACRYYIPHIRKENVDVIVSIDTSGSISPENLTSFISEIISMARQCHNITMTILVCDAEIHTVLPVQNGNIKTIMGLKIKGGGGTSHIPVYAWCDKNKGNASLLINFTDGYTAFPKKTNIPTLWVVSEGGADVSHFPFGKVVNM